MASGEFRLVPVAETVHVLIGPMLHMMLYEHSFGAGRLHGPGIDPAAVLAVQMDLMLRGLLAVPAAACPLAEGAVPLPSAAAIPLAFSQLPLLKDPAP